MVVWRSRAPARGRHRPREWDQALPARREGEEPRRRARARAREAPRHGADEDRPERHRKPESAPSQSETR